MHKTIIVAICGSLIKRTPSRHYWLYDGKRWVRVGLSKISETIKLPIDVIKAKVFLAIKKRDELMEKQGFNVLLMLISFVVLFAGAMLFINTGIDSNVRMLGFSSSALAGIVSLFTMGREIHMPYCF